MPINIGTDYAAHLANQMRAVLEKHPDRLEKADAVCREVFDKVSGLDTASAVATLAALTATVAVNLADSMERDESLPNLHPEIIAFAVFLMSRHSIHIHMARENALVEKQEAVENGTQLS